MVPLRNLARKAVAFVSSRDVANTANGESALLTTFTLPLTPTSPPSHGCTSLVNERPAALKASSSLAEIAASVLVSGARRDRGVVRPPHHLPDARGGLIQQQHGRHGDGAHHHPGASAA